MNQRRHPCFNLMISYFLFMICWQLTLAPCPYLCTCNDEKKKAECKDQRQLTYIPRFPSYIESVLFAGNNIPEVDETTFINLTDLSLKDFKFRHNNSSKLAANALSSLVHIEHLDLSGNSLISTNEIANCLAELKSPNLSSINLNSFGWKEEPTNIYQALSSFNIQKLQINKNFFRHLNMTELSKTFPNLTFLSAAYNNIESLSPGKMLRLKNLQLHHNYIDIDGMFGFPGNCFYPGLEILNLASNFVNYFKHKFVCLENLEKLILDKNPVKQIKKDILINLTSLQELHLNRLGDRLFKIQKYAFRSHTLKVLSFSQNHFQFTSISRHSFFDADLIFGDIPRLEELDLSENYFNISDGCLARMISGLRNMKKLTIKSCNFRTIPPDIFMHMQGLLMLNLSYNHISEWDGTQVFANLTSLQILRLDNNYINIINETSFPGSMIANFTMVDMARNPFYCGCMNLWFRRWIKEKEDLFTKFPQAYYCVTPPELKGTRLKDYFPSESECHPSNIFVHLVSALSLIGIFTVIIVSLVYKGRWHIRYWIYNIN